MLYETFLDISMLFFKVHKLEINRNMNNAKILTGAKYPRISLMLNGATVLDNIIAYLYIFYTYSVNVRI